MRGFSYDRYRRGFAALAHAGAHGGERDSIGRQIHFPFQEGIGSKAAGGGD